LQEVAMRRTISTAGLLVVLASSSAGAQGVLSPTHYDVSFDVDYPAEVLRASTRIALKNPGSTAATEASLLLYRLMRVQSVRDAGGGALAFSQEVTALDDRPKQQVNHLRVRLREPLAPAATMTLEITYSGHLLGYAETGMRYVQDRIHPDFTILRMDSYAYPQPGSPETSGSPVEARFTYAARVTVPSGLTVANGGRIDGVEPAGERVTFRFSSLKPSWRMDFAIAKYEELSSEGIRVYYLPGDRAGATGVAEAAARSIDLFTRWFGPKPQATSLTFIEIPDGWGSQADVTTVIQTAGAFRSTAQHNEVYHEISHLWNVPPTDRPDPRWSEGLATFLERLAAQELSGTPQVDEAADRRIESLRAMLPKRPELKTVALAQYGERGMTGLSYTVGGLFFDLLRRLAGPETFNRIIRAYVAEFGIRGGNTKDLIDVVRRTSTTDLSRLVEDWILTPRWTEAVERSSGIAQLESWYRRGASGSIAATSIR
jgi:aminopeptidase N